MQNMHQKNATTNSSSEEIVKWWLSVIDLFIRGFYLGSLFRWLTLGRPLAEKNSPLVNFNFEDLSVTRSVGLPEFFILNGIELLFVYLLLMFSFLFSTKGRSQ